MAVKVSFQRAGEPPLLVEAPVGSTLFDAGAQASAAIDTACVGKGTCGLCRVKVLAGAEALSPYSDEELRHLGNLYHLTKIRLACRARIVGTGGDAAAEHTISIEVVRKRRGR